MAIDFGSALSVGDPAELTTRNFGFAADDSDTEVSAKPRGLAMKSLTVDRNWDGLWGMLGRRQQIYFLAVSFDLSENDVVVLPPKELSSDSVYEAKKGETITFSLGGGAPIFPPRKIHGGLLTYITVCEADKGLRHIGEVVGKVHAAVDNDDGFAAAIKKVVTNPGKAGSDAILNAALAVLKPVGVVLENSSDDHLGLFSGIFPATRSWEDRLTETRNGTTIELGEI